MATMLPLVNLDFRLGVLFDLFSAFNRQKSG
jgi:hypothetical protein